MMKKRGNKYNKNLLHGIFDTFESFGPAYRISAVLITLKHRKYIEGITSDEFEYHRRINFKVRPVIDPLK